MKNPYHVLNLPRDADEKAIKEAYRRLARKHHPDVNPGNKEAEERFKDIQAAYDLLSDPQKREAFDRFGDGAFRPGGGFGGFGPEPGSGRGMPSFEDIFGEGTLQDVLRKLFGGGFAPGAAPHPASADLQGEIAISLEEAYNGAEKTLAMEGQAPVRVRIPAGVQDGKRLRVPGRGRGTASRRGDLYLRIRVLPDPRFERQGDDLYAELSLSLTEAALGGDIPVITPAGETRVRVPPGTPSGRLLRLAGRGFRRAANGSGDLYARVRIVPPPTPGPEERRLLEELARVSTYNPREPA